MSAQTPLEQETKNLKNVFGGLLAISFATNMLALTIPLYMIQVYSRVLPSQSTDTLIALTVLAFIALVTYGLLEGAKRILLNRSTTRFEARLGAPMLLSGFRTASAEVDIQGLQDIATIRKTLSSGSTLSLFDVPFLPIYILILFIVHPIIGIVAVIGSALLFVFAYINQLMTHKVQADEGKYTSQAYQSAQAQTKNRELVRALGMYNECVSRWGQYNAAALKAYATSSDRNAIFFGLSRAFRYFLQIAILGTGGYLVLTEQMSASVIFAAAVIGSRALGPIEASIANWRNLVNVKAAWGRIKIRLEMAIHDTDCTPLPEPTGHMEIRKLAYQPDRERPAILKGFSFQVGAGETIAVIGPSGAGKSTLAKILVGAIRPTSGVIRIDGNDLYNWDQIDLGRHIGYMPQTNDFFPGTIQENIARLRVDDEPEKAIEAARFVGIHKTILGFPNGYDTLLGPGGFVPSGGQQQLISLARAFYGLPKIVVLDEPNANLDHAGDVALAKTLERAKELGITVIFVTQRPSLLTTADRVLLLKAGVIDALGPKEEVLRANVQSVGKAKVAKTAS